MGNTKQALAIIINQLGDMEEVIIVFLFWNMLLNREFLDFGICLPVYIEVCW